MKKIFFLLVATIFMVSANAQNFQSNCEACYQTVNAAFAPNMARLFNFTHTADIRQSFRSWFFSDEFEKYARSSSTGIKIPVFDEILSFSNDSKASWERRKILMSDKSFQIDDHYFTKFWSVNPDISMAGEFNRALQSCNESPCSGEEGRSVFLRNVVRTGNSVTISFSFTRTDNTQKNPVISDIEYDKSIYSLDEKQWVSKAIKNTNTIVLKKKAGNTWPRSFFGISFRNGVRGISVFIDGEMTPGFLTYTAISGQIASCQPYEEGTFTNEGNHYNRLGGFPFNFRINSRLGTYTSGAGSAFEVWYVTEPNTNEATQLLQRTLPILKDGRKYRNITLVRQGEANAGVHNFVKIFVDYYEDGYAKPGLTESNHVVIRVYNRAEWVRFSISGQTCSYADQSVTGDLDVVFDSNNTAMVDLPNNTTSAVLRVQKNGVNYKIDLLNFANSTSSSPAHNVQNYFTVIPPAAGAHVYRVTYRER